MASGCTSGGLDWVLEKIIHWNCC